MTSVGAYQAKTHLSELLERVANGERITITKHGHPVARLVPVEENVAVDRDEVLRRLHEFGRGRDLGETGLRGLIEEGRRY